MSVVGDVLCCLFLGSSCFSIFACSFGSLLALSSFSRISSFFALVMALRSVLVYYILLGYVFFVYAAHVVS